MAALLVWGLQFLCTNSPMSTYSRSRIFKINFAGREIPCRLAGIVESALVNPWLPGIWGVARVGRAIPNDASGPDVAVNDVITAAGGITPMPGITTSHHFTPMPGITTSHHFTGMFTLPVGVAPVVPTSTHRPVPPIAITFI